MRIRKTSFNLPNSLLILIFGLLAQSPAVQAQAGALQLDRIASFQITSTQKSITIPLPQTSQSVVLSVELCTRVDDVDGPRFFASANTVAPGTSRSSNTGSSAIASSTATAPTDNGEEIDLGGGVGMWNSARTFENGGILRVQLDQTAKTGTWSFSVGISTNAPLHDISSTSPLYGDATSTSALLFSDPISETKIPFQEPSFPRYDLPPPIPSPPTAPDSAQAANSTLIILPSSALRTADNRLTSDLLNSGCFLQSLAALLAAAGPAPTITSSLVLRNQAEGWRTQFVVDNLQAATNYTIYTLTAQGAGRRLSKPAYFKTKSAAFACTLVHSLPFCPTVSWAAPFPPLKGNPTTYDSINFPPTIQQALTQSLGNFTASLKTFPCGREVYSIIQSCATCEWAYRNWLCSVMIPRCGEVDQTRSLPLEPPPALVARSITSANTTGTAARLDQTVFSSGNAVAEYVELLPCLETCHDVDRACPPNMQWSCPRKGLAAERSYGIGFVDREGDDISGGGIEGGGSMGMSQDAFGNVWCNAIL